MEGHNAEKLYDTSKQVPGSIELAKDMELSATETYTPISFTPLGSDCQIKTETSIAPSSENSARNPLMESGKYHCALCQIDIQPTNSAQRNYCYIFL